VIRVWFEAIFPFIYSALGKETFIDCCAGQLLITAAAGANKNFIQPNL